MSNWAAYKEKEIGLPVVKRAKHGIHFDAGKGLVQAEFVGKPVHYFDGKEYRAIDTKPLLRKDGTYGCAHSDVIIHTDGTVQVGEYSQKAALIYPGKLSVDGDRIARPFSGGVQYLYITEDGFRQEIVLEKMPDLRKVSALVDTVKGILPTKYTASNLSLKDSSIAELSDFVQVDKTSLASVLEAAKYPVVIDPDFAGSTADGHVYGQDAVYGTARSTSGAENTATSTVKVGQTTTYQVNRGYFLFDTSTIGAGSTVTQANLKLTVETDSSTTDFVLLVVKYAGGATREIRYDNLLSNDLDDGDFGSTGTGTWSANTQKTSGNLSTDWVNKTGTTYYGVVSEEDRNNSAPTNSEVIEWHSANASTEGYRPVLTVTYTASGIAIPVAQYYYNRLRRN